MTPKPKLFSIISQYLSEESTLLLMPLGINLGKRKKQNKTQKMQSNKKEASSDLEVMLIY